MLARLDLKPHRLRPATPDDLDALLAIETEAFTSDLISRRSLRRFLTASTATALVAEQDGVTIGYALVLFRAISAMGRLYSIAVAPSARGYGIGTALIAAAEAAALARGCGWMRLEVRPENSQAIARYLKAGYRQFGRRTDYYEDHGDALLFEKSLRRAAPEPPAGRTVPFSRGPMDSHAALVTRKGLPP